jgi:hypothetical protein
LFPLKKANINPKIKKPGVGITKTKKNPKSTKNISETKNQKNQKTWKNAN